VQICLLLHPSLLTTYGFNAATGAGALEIDEVWSQGSLAPIPEPASALLGSLGVLALLRRRMGVSRA
jgi:hypothetical protein